MPRVLSFDAPQRVCVVEEPSVPLARGQVRLRTIESGISAGTESTAYRGSNPYLMRRWDSARRLFVDREVGLRYPVRGWGYEECGEVVEVAGDVSSLAPGDRVRGQSGHRTETVQSAVKYGRRKLPIGVEPELGSCSQIGAIALNLILDADIHLGETVVLFALAAHGQLVAQVAALNGARVIAVDSLASRRDLAERLGADVVLDPGTISVAEQVWTLTDNRAAVVVLNVTGSYDAVHEAIRCGAYNSRVVVGSLLQGAGTPLRMGEVFHHNRIEAVSSQISGVASRCQHRWGFERLARTAMELITTGQVAAQELILTGSPSPRRKTPSSSWTPLLRRLSRSFSNLGNSSHGQRRQGDSGNRRADPAREPGDSDRLEPPTPSTSSRRRRDEQGRQHTPVLAASYPTDTLTSMKETQRS